MTDPTVASSTTPLAANADSPALSAQFYIDLENGKFSSTVRTDLASAFANYAAVGKGRPLVVHFHGGLVNKESGMAGAERLLPIYWKAGGYPLFFVWNAGLFDVISKNLPAIAAELIFQRLKDRALGFVVGRARALVPGARGDGFVMVDTDEVRAQAADDSTPEPFRDEADALRGADDLTDTDLREIEDKVGADPVLDREVDAIGQWAASQGIVPAGVAKSASGAAPKETLMDTEVVREIAGSALPDGKGLISMGRVATGVAKIVARAIKRIATHRDHGVYVTVVEEVLREFYFAQAGHAVWKQMKKDTLDAFSADPNVHGGSAFLDELEAIVKRGERPRIVLVGHSTGAVYICHLLQQAHDRLTPIEGGTKVTFDLVFLAGACTFDLLATTLENARSRIGNIRMFGMRDDLERVDQLIRLDKHPGLDPALKYLYPSSLLYFVSGVVEDDVDMPIVGLERFHTGDVYKKIHEVQTVRSFGDGVERSRVWSKAEGDAGLCSSSQTHGDFDNDEQTLASVSHIIRAGY